MGGGGEQTVSGCEKISMGECATKVPGVCLEGENLLPTCGAAVQMMMAECLVLLWLLL